MKADSCWRVGGQDVENNLLCTQQGEMGKKIEAASLGSVAENTDCAVGLPGFVPAMTCFISYVKWESSNMWAIVKI